MRLIDADKLNKVIKDKFGYSSATAYLRNMQKLSPVEVFKHIMRLIEEAPTVELDENIIQQVLNKRCMTAVTNEYLIALHNNRPTGEWEEIMRDFGYSCSICHYVSFKTNYCPNCGAKMEEQNND